MKKTVIITGGSEGLGKEIAKVLKDKYKVIILSSNLKKLKKTAKELKIDYFLCDISDYYQCEKTIKEIIEKYQKIDILINNAGTWIEGVIEKNDYSQIKKTVKVNLIGQIFITKAVIPFMKSLKSGVIIFINSIAGLETKAERSVYNSTKWGLRGFSESLRKELKNFKIKVISIFPGKIKTKLFENASVKKDLTNALNPLYIAKLIEFILNFPDEIFIFQAGIKNIND